MSVHQLEHGDYTGFTSQIKRKQNWFQKLKLIFVISSFKTSLKNLHVSFWVTRLRNSDSLLKKVIFLSHSTFLIYKCILVRYCRFLLKDWSETFPSLLVIPLTLSINFNKTRQSKSCFPYAENKFIICRKLLLLRSDFVIWWISFLALQSWFLEKASLQMNLRNLSGIFWLLFKTLWRCQMCNQIF